MSKNEKVNRLKLGKMIYASKKGKSKEEIQSIIRLECEEHLRKHPDLITEKIGLPVFNPDRSLTVLFYFKKIEYGK